MDPSCRDAVGLALAATFLPAATTPAVLPVDGATLWLDAGNGLSPPFWQDQSTNGYTLAGPMVVEENFINGQAAARCGTTGLSGGMSTFLNDGTGLASADVGTIFTVFRTTGPNSALFAWGHSSLGPFHRLALFTAFGNQLIFSFGVAAAGAQVVATQPAGFDNSWHILEASRNGSVGEVRLGGTAVTLDISGSFSANLALTEPGSLLVCSEGTAGVDFAGDLAELIVFKRALSTTERNTIRCYLEQKYALSGGCT